MAKLLLRGRNKLNLRLPAHGNRYMRLLVFIILGLCLQGCRGEKAPVNKELLESTSKRQNDPRNRKMVDSAISLLRSGDIVVRTGNDVTSYMLCQMNQRDKTYSHCGIVMMEHGYPFVYHSIGGEDNPDAKLRRDSANFWFSPAHNIGFGISRLDIPAGKQDSFSAIVRKYYQERKKFDMNFDLATDERFYCAELVYKAVNQAVGDTQYLQPIHILGYTFIGIDDIFLSRHASTVCQIRFK
jgi:hypothetical protein